MRRRQAVALRLEGEPPHARRRVPGLDDAGLVARADRLAGAPGEIPAAQGERVDPAALLVGDFPEVAIGSDRRHPPVVAACEQRLAVRNGCQDRRVGMGGDALLRLRLADENRAVGERQRRRLAEKGRRDDLRARRRRR